MHIFTGYGIRWIIETSAQVLCRKKFNEISSSVSSGNCKITIIDNRMIDCPGFAAKIFKSVAKSKTDLRIITTSIDEIAILTTKADCENTIKRIESILK